VDRSRPFVEKDAGDDPLQLFQRWLEQARRHVELPEAVTLATATPEGRPSARMVLLKTADERGFTFFTN
jgi:pyridoxamine 5'-phosphate oxidase